MHFVGLIYDVNSASVTAIMYEISWYTGPLYNGTRLYMFVEIDHVFASGAVVGPIGVTADLS